jgi:hypothetical protein
MGRTKFIKLDNVKKLLLVKQFYTQLSSINELSSIKVRVLEL